MALLGVLSSMELFRNKVSLMKSHYFAEMFGDSCELPMAPIQRLSLVTFRLPAYCPLLSHCLSI
jgi:hypothetical protein